MPMTFLRTVAACMLLILPLHAQAKDPSAADASAAIVEGGVAVYATLSNPAMYDIYIQSGAVDGGKVELRDGDPSAPLGAGKPAATITVPSFAQVELKPGGPFVLVTGLKTQPKPGETIALTLNTDGGISIAIAAVVK